MRIYQWMVLGLGLGLSLATAPVLAGQVYKWVDPAGRIHYGDQPQPGWKPVEVKAPKATGSPSGEFNARAPDALTTPPGDAEQCESKRRTLDSYKTAGRLVERDSLGREKEFTAEDRQKLIDSAQRDVDRACGQQQ